MTRRSVRMLWDSDLATSDCRDSILFREDDRLERYARAFND